MVGCAAVTKFLKKAIAVGLVVQLLASSKKAVWLVVQLLPSSKKAVAVWLVVQLLPSS